MERIKLLKLLIILKFIYLFGKNVDLFHVDIASVIVV